METKHTSGPWFIMGGDGFGNIQISGAPFDSEHNDPLWHAVTTGPTDEERSANAALICAAPDLLAALEQVEAAFFSPGVVLPDWEPLFEALGSVRGAIRKAKGE